MPCYHPLKAYRAAKRNPSGKRGVTFRQSESNNSYINLPCGQCIGCRLERSRQWAIRCLHEASQHDQNCFVTLTYQPDQLPPGGSLVVRDFQLFMKRLRKSLGDKRVRFFHCGEYGEELARPHYHALLFGHDFSDRILWSSRDGVRLFRSSELEALWPYGFATVGDATFESAAYVARYCVKKVTGKCADAHYQGRHPEYVTMSRRPGIGTQWFDKFSTDVFPSDEVVIRGGIRCKPPKFYDKLLEARDVELSRAVRGLRRFEAKEESWDERCQVNLEGDTSGARLAVRGEVKEAQSTFLKRGLHT